jgi:hypothetical protein
MHRNGQLKEKNMSCNPRTQIEIDLNTTPIKWACLPDNEFEKARISQCQALYEISAYKAKRNPKQPILGGISEAETLALLDVAVMSVFDRELTADQICDKALQFMGFKLHRDHFGVVIIGEVIGRAAFADA